MLDQRVGGRLSTPLVRPYVSQQPEESKIPKD
jgi:hypothetical protein